jgi:hypothetical protein
MKELSAHAFVVELNIAFRSKNMPFFDGFIVLFHLKNYLFSYGFGLFDVAQPQG